MNNSLLFQLIAARASGSGNTGVADLLSRMRGMNGGSPVQDPKQLLAQLGNNNPLASALSKHFAEAQADDSLPQRIGSRPDVVIDVEPESPKQIGSNGNGRRSQPSEHEVELEQQVQNLQGEVKALRDRCELLASTVGACCLCWGQDPDCRGCRGRGKPGYAIPDEALFGEFVLPAIRVLRAQKVKLSRPVATQRPQNGEESSSQIS